MGKKEIPPVPKKGKERKRKEKLVKKRNALREREERRKDKHKQREEKREGQREEDVSPLIYVQVYDGGRKYETRTSAKVALRKPWQKPNPEEVRSVISGEVLSISVMEGDLVTRNQPVMVFEAMKMHNNVCAPFSGVVERILVSVGDKLPKGALMMVIRSCEEAETEDANGPQEPYDDDFVHVSTI